MRANIRSWLICVLLSLLLVEIHVDVGVHFKNKYCDPNRPGLTPDQAKAAMDVCFVIFLNERDYRPENRRAVIERVCITLLMNASTAAVRQFYLHHIKDIIGLIEAKQAKVLTCNHLLCELQSQISEKSQCMGVDVLVSWKHFFILLSFINEMNKSTLFNLGDT